ncbi:hypothetical protein F5888DRAFT_1758318 [Russula emetica]|nr:hypothetical protein F5888DRAFT_1758318 [Russula emetica]
MSISRWKDDFRPPEQHRVINPIWNTAFQVIGALRKEYALPFNSCFGICCVVVVEIITPFTYTKIK